MKYSGKIIVVKQELLIANIRSSLFVRKILTILIHIN